MDALLRLAMVVALLVNTAVLVTMVFWAGRVVAQLAACRAAIGQLREALAGVEARIESALIRSEHRVRATVADSQAAVERAIHESTAARKATERAIQRLDWTTDHMLDTTYPPHPIEP